MVALVALLTLLISTSLVSCDFDTYTTNNNNITIIGESGQGSKIVNELTRGCPDKFLRYRKSCYYFGVLSVTWHEAKEICNKLGAERVAVETYDEDMFITEHLYTLIPLYKKVNPGVAFGGLYWTDGVNRELGKKNFKWETTGTPLYTNARWSRVLNEPSHYKTHEVAPIFYHYDPTKKNDRFAWADHPSKTSIPVGIICEKAATN